MLECDHLFCYFFEIQFVHDLLTVVRCNKRGFQYIISKIVDAIDGIYCAESSRDDKDVAVP